MPICSNVFNQFFLFTIAIAVGVTSSSAEEITIPAYKENLFNYSAVLETDFNGAYELKDYDEMRDVNGRDEIPVKRSLPQYVDQDIIGSETDESLTSNGTKVEYLQVGASENASFVVIFAHGSNGTKLLGMQDWTFGGNFNRLKHFAIYENGTYISPSFTDFKSVGAKQIEMIVKHVREVSPEAKIILACASSGGEICKSVFLKPQTLANISGFILMATGTAPTMFASRDIKSWKGPIFMLHGTEDKLVPYPGFLESFKRFKTSNPDYPVRFQLFKTGVHGTPIRMIDWRDALNWILSFSVQP